MIYSTTVLFLIFIFVGLGFALGWAWCDKKMTDEIIDHATKFDLFLGISKDDVKEGNPYVKKEN